MRFIILYLVLVILILFPDCEGYKEEEREALLQIKTSINSPEGTAFSSWSGEDCCQWEAVECDASTSRVMRLSFWYARGGPEKREEGSIQPWYPNATLFAQFKDLQELYLIGNQIAGFISPHALNKLKHLRKLDLHDNLIANSPHLCWGDMPNLSSLDLSRNKLQGEIPKCLCESQSFTELNLSDNQLEGNIDACLSNTTSLRYLFLSHNHFNGTFPSLLFQNLTNIESFVISNNDFRDVLSFSTLANLSKLNYLDISSNHDLEIETESPTWSPTFSLKQLKLAGCNLNKRSGRKIPDFLSTQYHLESLDLSNNSLVGSIPSWLIYNLSSALWVHANNLSGPFPRTERNISSKLVTLDISHNALYGQLPADFNLGFPELRNLSASQNMFTSSIPLSFSEMRQLRYLDLSGNILQGEVPYGMFRNMTSLELLKLSENNLKGEVLARNFSLPHLRWLCLDRNGFADDLSTSSFVLPEIRVLTLKENYLKGRVPVQVCQMRHLHVLDLSGNDLSGEIPTCLNNITSLIEENIANDFGYQSWATIDFVFRGILYTYTARTLRYLYAIDFSDNKLTGTIPIQMTELRRIEILNMSNNLLTGEIPPSLSNLKVLESLDLSYNGFSGTLPPSLTEMTFLAAFYVSFNNFSGPIPLKGQFETFDNSSYLGNPNLCGKPLQKKCDDESAEKSGWNRKEKKIDRGLGSANSDILLLHIALLCLLITVNIIVTNSMS